MTITWLKFLGFLSQKSERGEGPKVCQLQGASGVSAFTWEKKSTQNLSNFKISWKLKIFDLSTCFKPKKDDFFWYILIYLYYLIQSHYSIQIVNPYNSPAKNPPTLSLSLPHQALPQPLCRTSGAAGTSVTSASMLVKREHKDRQGKEIPVFPSKKCRSCCCCCCCCCFIQSNMPSKKNPESPHTHTPPRHRWICSCFSFDLRHVGPNAGKMSHMLGSPIRSMYGTVTYILPLKSTKSR